MINYQIFFNYAQTVIVAVFVNSDVLRVTTENMLRSSESRAIFMMPVLVRAWAVMRSCRSSQID